MTGQKPILSVAVFSPLRKLFDYLPPQDIDEAKLLPGIRLLVPFNKRHIIGVLINCKKNSTISTSKLKQAIELLDEIPIFNKDVFDLCQWAADYYHASLGDLLLSALPKSLRIGKSIKLKKITTHEARIIKPSLQLSIEQSAALRAILQYKNFFQTFLLEGVTGSGKTEVYLQAIANIIADKKQALVLIPEISLTPQTIARFHERFNVPVVAIHSSLSEGERAAAWLAAKNGEAKIVIGTRSAIFTPFKDLGLIIVDEEHDASFKQQDRSRYHARDLAIVRAKFHNIPIVLGSATPSIESYLNVERNRYIYLSMPTRAGRASLPTYQLIDLSKHYSDSGLTQPLCNAITAHLNAGNQVLVFLNRRGFAPVYYCSSCHHVMECMRCAARLVFHKNPQRLQCHHCDKNYPLPEKCLSCSEKTLEAIGIGTQRLEKKLLETFTQTPIIRIDRDNTRRKGAMDELLMQMKMHPSAILLGTQMIAKGHHFPNVTLTCIIDIDSALLSADFRAIEQLSQLIVQVGGRAGREEKPGTVLIQTRNPEHHLLTTLLRDGYPQFIKNLLKERKQATLPPYSFCALFKAESYQEENAKNFLQCIKEMTTLMPQISLYGPFKPLLTKKKGLHSHHLLVKSNQRKTLQLFLQQVIPKLEKSKRHIAKWAIDVDPIEF